MRVTYNKLVRDRVPEIISQDGHRASTHAYALIGMFTRSLRVDRRLRRSASQHRHSYPGHADRLLFVLEIPAELVGGCMQIVWFCAPLGRPHLAPGRPCCGARGGLGRGGWRGGIRQHPGVQLCWARDRYLAAVARWPRVSARWPPSWAA